jgi:hypothetical protein
LKSICAAFGEGYVMFPCGASWELAVEDATMSMNVTNNRQVFSPDLDGKTTWAFRRIKPRRITELVPNLDLKPFPMPPKNNESSPIAATIVVLCTVLLLLCIVYFIKGPFGSRPQPSASLPVVVDSSSSFTQRRDTTTSNDQVKVITITNTSVIKTASARPKETKDETADRLTTLLPYFILLFSILIVVMVLPRIKKLALNKEGIDIDLIEMAKEFNEAQQASVQEVGPPPPVTDADRKLATKDFNDTRKTENTDPQAGKWGGTNEANNRRLTAKIKRIANTDIAEILLSVVSTDPAKHPLTGAVQFHLHPTFVNSTPVIFALNGKAELRLQAWGAFTVGVEADKGATHLELNLQNQPGTFEPFNSR